MAELTDELAILAAAAEFAELHIEFERTRACVLRVARDRVDRLALKLVPDEGLTDEARAVKALPLALGRVNEARRRLETEAV